jgi:calcineurin-like phosphoesterase
VRLHGVHLEVDDETGRCRHIERVSMALSPSPGVPVP